MLSPWHLPPPRWGSCHSMVGHYDKYKYPESGQRFQRLERFALSNTNHGPNVPIFPQISYNLNFHLPTTIRSLVHTQLTLLQDAAKSLKIVCSWTHNQEHYLRNKSYKMIQYYTYFWNYQLYLVKTKYTLFIFQWPSDHVTGIGYINKAFAPGGPSVPGPFPLRLNWGKFIQKLHEFNWREN
jgi:hypothetical protein